MLMSTAPGAAMAAPRSLPDLPQRLTHEQADAYVQRCLAVMESGGAVPVSPATAVSPAPAQTAAALWSLDAAALQHFDSSALAALLAVARLLQARGGRLQVLHMPLRLRELAALYGVSELLAA